jgi:hypothetical protein
MSITDPAPPLAGAAPQAASPLASQAASPPPARRPPRRLPLSKDDVIVFLLAVNLIGLVGLGVRVYRGDRPTVVTVAITQMAREYMGRLATSNVSPEVARIRAQMFLAVVQDTVRNAAVRQGMIVMPRECVLAGEYSDLTADVSRAVNETLQRHAQPTPAAAPLPTTTGAVLSPPAGGVDAGR